VQILCNELADDTLIWCGDGVILPFSTACGCLAPLLHNSLHFDDSELFIGPLEKLLSGDFSLEEVLRPCVVGVSALVRERGEGDDAPVREWLI